MGNNGNITLRGGVLAQSARSGEKKDPLGFCRNIVSYTDKDLPELAHKVLITVSLCAPLLQFISLSKMLLFFLTPFFYPSGQIQVPLKVQVRAGITRKLRTLGRMYRAPFILKPVLIKLR